ncbi:FMN-binding protein [Streptomyces sp. PTM05]|uniref:FMN-binding protein n=1 Tax=Streptantibioticus parmotrematis TaxID=2873249 RepID=A0ABS7QUL3_9ACTN|nr:FMN-binding protein [Streptantibioticus parmotrematis]MBY8886897.1 FMN-binding protein [Streptantibioticus parmotrematis]
MRATTAALALTGCSVALLIGVRAGTGGLPRSALTGADRAAGTHPGVAKGTEKGTPDGTTPAPAPATSTRTTTTPAAATGTFTGAAEDTPYGTVQVEAVVRGGKLTDVTVLQQTHGGRSDQIDAYALPVLRSEALAAGSADIDVVSGATYTSGGYARSLQAALDAARR